MVSIILELLVGVEVVVEALMIFQMMLVVVAVEVPLVYLTL
jgi:hypothetical protein